VREINERFDIRGNALATLLLSAFQNHGTVSKHRRKQFADVVPEAAFDFIGEVVRRHLAEQPRADGTQGPPSPHRLSRRQQ
jgi:hypothetical protein